MTAISIIAAGLIAAIAGSELALHGTKLQTGLARVLTAWGSVYAVSMYWLLVHDGLSPVAFTIFWGGTFLSWFGVRSHIESSILLRMLVLLRKRPLTEGVLVAQYLSLYGEARRVEELCRGGLAQKDHADQRDFQRKDHSASGLCVAMIRSAASSILMGTGLRFDSRLGAPVGAADQQRPLCVNADGLLVADPLWEGVLSLLRRQPWVILLVPIWALGRKDRIRRALADRMPLNASALPYRTDLVEILRSSAENGRRLVLVATTDVLMAQAVAEHLGFFEEVVDGTSQTLSHSLEARFGTTGFDYVACAEDDLPVLDASTHGYVVGANRSFANRALNRRDDVQVLSTRRSIVSAIIKVVRPHQWAKNALVVLPMVLAPGRPSLHQVMSAAVAAIAFSLCASAGYVFNDHMDVEADRAHRTKQRRPFASGDLPVVYGPPLFLALFAASFGIALTALPLSFVAMLALYFVLTLAYSSVLKSKLVVDVVVLAWLYTHRVLAGGIATGITISAWLLAFSMFIFSSLAFAKRYVELRRSVKSGQLKSRGYHTGDLEMVASMGPAAGYMAVLVFCLYVDSDVVADRYHTPIVLWFIAPVLLYWISRVWFLSHRDQMQDDPVKFALTDSRSWICAVFVTLAAAVARFWPN